MDFVFAAYPWIITWNLDMRRVEKIGLCVTMSLVSKQHLHGIITKPLTRSTGYGRRHRVSRPHQLEVRR
jgi:hypothetical protein